MIETKKIGKGYDRVSRIYDRTVNVVFGKSIDVFQAKSISSLNRSKHTLILGGGSGRILLQALDANQSAFFTYFEASQNMLDLSRQRVSETEKSRIRFIQSLDESIGNFDTVILPFVLDCYRKESIKSLLEQIINRCEADCEFLVVDFSKSYDAPFLSKRLHSFLIWMLYQFFFNIGATETKTLPNIDAVLSFSGLQKKSEKVLYSGWISASQWRYAETMMAAA